VHGGVAIERAIVETAMSTYARAAPLLAAVPLLVGIVVPALAQPHIGPEQLVVDWASSQKVEQLIGDDDWASGEPVAGQTISNGNVLGTDTGYSFMHCAQFDGANDRCAQTEPIFLFGDTIGSGYRSDPCGGANPAPCSGSGGVSLRAVGNCSTAYDGHDTWATVNGPFNAASAIALRIFTSSARCSTSNASVMPQFITPCVPGESQCVTGGTIGGRTLQYGGDDIPNSGIDLVSPGATSGTVYMVYNSGSKPSAKPGAGGSCGCKAGDKKCDPHAEDFSVLLQAPTPGTDGAFQVLRPLSQTHSGGHFVFTALHKLPASGTEPAYVLVYGLKDPRHSNVYLAMVPEAEFGQPALQQPWNEDWPDAVFFGGWNNDGSPKWLHNDPPTASYPDELDSLKPVVSDPIDPSNPSIGNISVSYTPDLGLWLMTLYGGKCATSASTGDEGIYFTYARNPWGPWATPQLIYSACRDAGFSDTTAASSGFIFFVPSPSTGCAPATEAVGPPGPMIGYNGGPGPTSICTPTTTANDPVCTRGAAYAPQMIEQFTLVDPNARTLSIDYTLSTWNPYTVVRMRSEFRWRWEPDPDVVDCHDKPGGQCI
jgi:hypothetical protein